MKNDSDAETAENKVSHAEMITEQAKPPVKWIVFCSIFAAIVGTALTLFSIDYTMFEPGPFMAYWIVPAIVFSVFLSIALTNFRVSDRRVAASVLSAAITVPISLVLLYVSILGFMLYGLASGP